MLLESIYDKTQILCRPHKSRSIESIWYGPYLLTPYIISQCENHTIQERKCLPTFILAIIVNFNGFEETIANFQWFLRKPSPLNVFLVVWPLPSMVFQWFLILLPSLSMVFDGSGTLVKRCDGFDGSSWSTFVKLKVKFILYSNTRMWLKSRKGLKRFGTCLIRFPSRGVWEDCERLPSPKMGRYRNVCQNSFQKEIEFYQTEQKTTQL